MKKYKLIKEYPGSPKLGTEIINNENVNSAHTLDRRNYYNGCRIQDYPEFWEEIVEKDYEILSFRRIKLDSMCCTGVGDIIKATEEDDNFDPTFDTTVVIHSVKRLSDDEIFTIGDNTNGGIIESFNIWECPKNTPQFKDTLQISVSKDDDWWELEDIKHIKKPLFTTEDGVEIFVGYIWTVSKSKYGLTKWFVNNPDKHTLKEKLLHYYLFSTKEAAENYIEENKPQYSLNDIRNAWRRGKNATINNLKQLK